MQLKMDSEESAYGNEEEEMNSPKRAIYVLDSGSKLSDAGWSCSWSSRS